MEQLNLEMRDVEKRDAGMPLDPQMQAALVVLMAAALVAVHHAQGGPSDDGRAAQS